MTMEDAVNVRPATLRDLELLFDLHRIVFRHHIEEIWGWDEAWQRSRFRQEFESSETSVVELAGQIIGYVQTDSDPSRLYLRNIALHPDVQGNGIVTSLVRQLQRNAAKRGVPVYLSVFRTNRQAQEFYDRLGFLTTGRTDELIEMSWNAGQARPGTGDHIT
jgi:ribosomal protein S18 acetylase RimI-like enzyme